MLFFEKLAARVEDEWRGAGFAEEAFPALAAEALRDAEPHRHLDQYAALDWLLAAQALPPQHNLDDPFGRPAVQVVQRDGFYIEVFHWFDGTTEIHQHAFCGAFHLLAGSSVHARYHFRAEEQLGPHLRRGQLALQKVEWLRQGDTRQIVAGSALIHSLFHLERPSVTIVVRTLASKQAPTQLSYWPPSLAINPRHRPEPLVRRAQALEALAGARRPGWEDQFLACGRKADALSLVHLALAVARGGVPPRQLVGLLEQLRQTHGAMVDTIAAVAKERARQQTLVALRTRLHEPDHRFLLALLLNIDSAEAIAALVQEARPADDAPTLILRWIEEIGRALPPGDPARPLFDLVSDPTVNGLINHLLTGGSRLPEVLPDGVNAARRALGGSLLGPLFR
jgi:predicted metal-dependent enzyme (double-stranded beta helix superfamily)